MSLVLWKTNRKPVRKSHCSTNLDSFAKDFFNHSFPTFNQFFEQPVSSPTFNILEDDKAFEIEVALAGVPKEAVSIEVKDNLLTIATESKTENTEEKTAKKYIRKSFAQQSFKRSFHIPKQVDQEKISATHTNGILKVTLAKKEVEVKESKFIDIN